MKILSIDHIGIASKSIDQAAPFWTEALGIRAGGREVVEEQKAATLFSARRRERTRSSGIHSA